MASSVQDILDEFEDPTEAATPVVPAGPNDVSDILAEFDEPAITEEPSVDDILAEVDAVSTGTDDDDISDILAEFDEPKDPSPITQAVDGMANLGADPDKRSILPEHEDPELQKLFDEAIEATTVPPPPPQVTQEDRDKVEQLGEGLSESVAGIAAREILDPFAGFLRGTLRTVGSLGNISEWLVSPRSTIGSFPLARIAQPSQEKAAQASKEFSTWFNEKAEGKAIAKPKNLTWKSNPVANALSVTSEALPLFGTAMAATIATKSPVPAAIIFGLTEGAGSFSKAREAGKTVEESDVMGLLNGAWNAATEALPFGRMLGRAGQKAVKRIAQGAVEEGTQELIQTVGTNLIEKFGFDKDRAVLTMDEFLNAIVSGGILGGAAGGVIGSRTAAKAVPEEAGNFGTKADAAFDKNDVELAANIKKQREPVLQFLARQIVDQEADVKRVLKNAGAEDVVRSKVLAQGASAWANRVHKDAWKSVTDVLPNGQIKVLSKYIEFTRNIEATGIQADKGVKLKSRQGTTPEQSKEWLAKFEADTDPVIKQGVKDAAEEYWTVLRGQLTELRDAGLISKETHAELSKNQPFYSPRQFVEFIDPEVGTDTKGARQLDSGIDSLKEGSESAMVNDPNFLLAQVIGRTQSRVFKNQANSELADFIRANPDSEVGRIHRMTVSDPNDPTGFKEVGKSKLKNDEGIVTAFQDGREIQLAMPRKLAEQWNGLTPALGRDVANLAQWITGTKPLKFIATGANPEFALSNLPRDMAFAWFNSGQYSKFIPRAFVQELSDLGAVAKDSFMRTGAYNDYLKEGGGMDYLSTQGKLLTKPWTARGRGTTALAQLSDALAYLGETSETAMRLAVRNRAIKNGSTPREATFIARNMLDFAQGGRTAKFADNILPYFNAAIQGTRGTLRTMKTDPGGSALKIIQLIALGYANGQGFRAVDEEGYDAVSDREKATKWIIPLGFSKTDKEGNKRHAYIAIAKDQGQQVFSAIGQSLSDAMAGRPWSGQLLDATFQLLPVESATITPPVWNACTAYHGNYDTWTKEKIWSGYSDVSANKEFTVTSPKIAQDISEMAAKMKVKISPDRLARATSKLIPWSNPIAAGLVDLYELCKTPEGNATMVEMSRKIPGLRRFLRFSQPTDIREELKDDADKFGISIEGKTKQEILTDIKVARIEQSDDRQDNNVSSDTYLRSRDATKSGYRAWLSANIEDVKERQRLWRRGKSRKPELINSSYGRSRARNARTRGTR